MRLLPEEVSVRRAVGEGVGRSLRDIYQASNVIPDRFRGLLARVEQANRVAMSEHDSELIYCCAPSSP
jgi:hypothetical protein